MDKKEKTWSKVKAILTFLFFAAVVFFLYKAGDFLHTTGFFLRNKIISACALLATVYGFYFIFMELMSKKRLEKNIATLRNDNDALRTKLNECRSKP